MNKEQIFKNYDEISKDILSKCINDLREDSLDEVGVLMAQNICYTEKDNNDYKELIIEYTELADQKTNGMFSIMMERWDAETH